MSFLSKLAKILDEANEFVDRSNDITSGAQEVLDHVEGSIGGVVRGYDTVGSALRMADKLVERNEAGEPVSKLGMGYEIGKWLLDKKRNGF